MKLALEYILLILLALILGLVLTLQVVERYGAWGELDRCVFEVYYARDMGSHIDIGLYTSCDGVLIYMGGNGTVETRIWMAGGYTVSIPRPTDTYLGEDVRICLETGDDAGRLCRRVRVS